MWSVFNHWVFIHSWLLSSAVCGFVLVDVLWFFCFWLCIWNSFVFCLIISFCLSWCCQVYSEGHCQFMSSGIRFRFQGIAQIIIVYSWCVSRTCLLPSRRSFQKILPFPNAKLPCGRVSWNFKNENMKYRRTFSQVSIIRAVGQPWNWLQLATLFSVKPTGKTLKKPTIDFLKSLPYYSCKLAQIDDWGFMH